MTSIEDAATLLWRVGKNSDDIKELQTWSKQVDVDRTTLILEVRSLGAEVRSMKRAAYTLATAIIMATIGFAFTVLQVVN